jgi:branched-chain amino acid transport system substrate-binding protein
MKKLLAVLLVLAMVLAMSTCAIAEGDKVIKLGVLFPYTGSAAAVAEDAQKGIEFAISEINDRGGIQSMGGAKIELYYGDTQSNEEAAATEAERLITNIGVSALMGCYQSAITASVQTVCERYHVPLAITCSTSDILTEGAHPYSVTIHEQNSDTTKTHAQFIADMNEKEPGCIKTAAILYQNDDWGQSLSDGWYDALEEIGVEIIIDEVFAADVTDLTTVVTKLIDKQPDVVLNACYFQSMVLLTQTFVGMGFEPKAMLCSSSGETDNDFIPTVGNNADGFFTVSGWGEDVLLSMPDKTWIGEKYKELYEGEHYTAESAAGWSAAMVICEGLEAAGTDESEALNAAIRALKIPRDSWWNIYPYELEFDQETGKNFNAIPVMGQFQDTKIKLIYPEFIQAEGTELVFPGSQLSPINK